MLVVMAGLPGSGKTTIASRLSAKLNAVLLSKDEVRASLFPAELIEYSSRQDDFCIEIILQVARYLLERNSETIVIIDGRTFSKRAQVERVRAAALEFQTPLKIIECVCPEETARNRIEQDQGIHLAGNRDLNLFHRLKAEADEIAPPKLTLYTDQMDVAESVRAAEDYLVSAENG